jgi:Mg/Co/Ni transporter MgtE
MSDIVSSAMVTIPKTHSRETALEEIRDLFEDDHVRMALIVDAEGRLLTTIERSDLGAAAEKTPVSELGTLVGRTARPSHSLATSAAVLKRARRRRLAVVDNSGRLVGLLCLKQDGNGFCSDEGIRRRTDEAARSER